MQTMNLSIIGSQHLQPNKKSIWDKTQTPGGICLNLNFVGAGMLGQRALISNAVKSSSPPLSCSMLQSSHFTSAPPPPRPALQRSKCHALLKAPLYTTTNKRPRRSWNKPREDRGEANEMGNDVKKCWALNTWRKEERKRWKHDGKKNG